MRNPSTGFFGILFRAIPVFVLSLTILGSQAVAQYLPGRGTQRAADRSQQHSFRSGSYLSPTNVRSNSVVRNRSGSSYSTTYFTDRSPVYGYSGARVTSRDNPYTRSPYPRSTQHDSASAIQNRQLHDKIYSYPTRYDRSDSGSRATQRIPASRSQSVEQTPSYTRTYTPPSRYKRLDATRPGTVRPGSARIDSPQPTTRPEKRSTPKEATKPASESPTVD